MQHSYTVYVKGSVAPAISILDVKLPTDKLGVSVETTLHRSPKKQLFMRCVVTKGDIFAYVVSAGAGAQSCANY